MIRPHHSAQRRASDRLLSAPWRGVGLHVLSGIAGGACGTSPKGVGVPIQIESRAPTRVWVVDDDPVVALYLGELLHEHGFSVTTFENPQAALQAYEADPRRVDVVVMDQRMPELSGDVLARAMLRLRPQVRVILCTGHCDVIDERRALAIGVQHFFRKPFDAQALLRAVRGSDVH